MRVKQLDRPIWLQLSQKIFTAKGIIETMKTASWLQLAAPCSLL